MRYDLHMQETATNKRLGYVRPVWKQPDAEAIAKLMEALMQGDEAEQRETFEALKRGLDEHRPEGYKLFS
jgi:hypothetical protein